MIIDLHLHTSEYSECSKVSFQEIVAEALRKGLDGICITDHDTMAGKRFLQDPLPEDLLVFIGIEVLTCEGDILVFGVDDLPAEQISAQALTEIVTEKGGACIAAHPFRKNLRGVGNHLKSLEMLTAVEGFNGNTTVENNVKAATWAVRLDKPVIGASDAHKSAQVGCYATYFPNPIRNLKDLITQLQEGLVKPMFYDEASQKYQPIKEK